MKRGLVSFKGVAIGGRATMAVEDVGIKGEVGGERDVWKDEVGDEIANASGVSVVGLSITSDGSLVLAGAFIAEINLAAEDNTTGASLAPVAAGGGEEETWHCKKDIWNQLLLERRANDAYMLFHTLLRFAAHTPFPLSFI